MDWVESLNRALDYIEDNLCGDITCGDVASHVFISSSHLQRAFVLLTGLTIGEYIRNRRLTLAGQELAGGGTKVVDVALKYGYDTPESFSKAFSRFHGVSPGQARKDGASLRSYNRLAIKIIMEGGTFMDYRIEKKEAFNAIVKARMFGENSDKEIPAFWDEYFAQGLHKQIAGAMGVCGEVMEGGKFMYGIGCPEEWLKGENYPEGFESWAIPAATWAIFKCVGPMPDSIQDMWKRIYSEWLPQSKYEIVPGHYFEYYTEGDTASADYISEIWIPIREK
jgi:AraC family transcriptional regulator